MLTSEFKKEILGRYDATTDSWTFGNPESNSTSFPKCGKIVSSTDQRASPYADVQEVNKSLFENIPDLKNLKQQVDGLNPDTTYAQTPEEILNTGFNILGGITNQALNGEIEILPQQIPNTTIPLPGTSSEVELNADNVLEEVGNITKDLQEALNVEDIGDTLKKLQKIDLTDPLLFL